VFISLFSLLLVYFLLSLLLLLSKLKPSINLGCGAGFTLLAGYAGLLRDPAECFVALWALIDLSMLFWPILGLCWSPVVTGVHPCSCKSESLPAPDTHLTNTDSRTACHTCMTRWVGRGLVGIRCFSIIHLWFTRPYGIKCVGRIVTKSMSNFLHLCDCSVPYCASLEAWKWLGAGQHFHVSQPRS
jgi:hypothetical protein